MGYLDKKNKLNLQKVLHILEKKKKLYIKLLLVSKYRNYMANININLKNKKLKIKNFSLWLFYYNYIYQTHVKKLKNNKFFKKIIIDLIPTKKTKIKCTKITKFLRIRRLRRKRVKNRGLRYWVRKNMLIVKGLHRDSITFSSTAVELNKFYLNKQNYFFFKGKKKKKIIKNKKKKLINKLRLKIKFLLNSTLNPMLRSMFKSRIKLKSTITSKTKVKFIIDKKKTNIVVLRWLKNNYVSLYSQLLTFYSSNILKKKKYINRKKQLYSRVQIYSDLKFEWDLKETLYYVKIKKIKKKYLNTLKLNINFQNIGITYNKKKKNIFNYLFLSKSSVKSFYIDFYVNSKKTKNIKKNNVKKKKKIYYFNFWQKKLTTFKRARNIHWRLFSKKTIKKRRYKNFLFFYLKKNADIIHIFNYFIITFQLSHIFWSNFTSLYVKFYKKLQQKKQIYQLPISIFFWYFLKKHQSKKFKIKKRIKRWIAIKKRIKRRFWMKQKKNIPNFFSKQVYTNNKVLNNIQFDYITNYFCVLKKNSSITLLNKIINNNKLLKLHNFRYKS